MSQKGGTEYSNGIVINPAKTDEHSYLEAVLFIACLFFEEKM